MMFTMQPVMMMMMMIQMMMIPMMTIMIQLVMTMRVRIQLVMVVMVIMTMKLILLTMGVMRVLTILFCPRRRGSFVRKLTTLMSLWSSFDLLSCIELNCIASYCSVDNSKAFSYFVDGCSLLFVLFTVAPRCFA